MDIIHGLSNSEIETTRSSSQEEEEVMRNWLELPADVTSLIFLKLGTIGFLVSAQWVCTSWWKLSKQPHLFRSIHLDGVSNLSLHSGWLGSSLKLSMEAIDRSCGQLVEFSVRTIANDELLRYMSEKSSSLRCLGFANYDGFVTDDGLIEIAKKLPQLEELEVIHSNFSKDVIETFGRFCPRLKSCRLNFVTCYTTGTEFDGAAGTEFDDSVALAIAKNMSELCHLNLIGDKLKDNSLRAILDGCPHLESLNLRRCFGLKFSGDLEKRCKNITVLRLPNDPEYDFSIYDPDNEYNSDYGMYDDDENYESSDDYNEYALDPHNILGQRDDLTSDYESNGRLI